jgi:hypothetical protein
MNGTEFQTVDIWTDAKILCCVFLSIYIFPYTSILFHAYRNFSAWGSQFFFYKLVPVFIFTFTVRWRYHVAVGVGIRMDPFYSVLWIWNYFFGYINKYGIYRYISRIQGVKKHRIRIRSTALKFCCGSGFALVPDSVTVEPDSNPDWGKMLDSDPDWSRFGSVVPVPCLAVLTNLGWFHP